MIDLRRLQREIYQNKVARGFNVTDVGKEINNKTRTHTGWM